MPTSATSFEQARVDVRIQISALWISMLFLFAYGDIFGFFEPGRLEDVARGEVSGIEITQTFLVAVSLYIAIASVMVFLTLVLRPAVARWTNVVLPILYVASIVASLIGESSPYFWLLSLAEIVLLGAIVWLAWRWRTSEPAA
jgi:Family of unknown function (DUF6326)